MPSNHLILCHPLLLLPPIPPSIRVSSDESTLHITWPKYWSFSFSISPSNEYSGLISLLSKGLSKVFSNTKVQKHHFFFWCSAFFIVQLSHPSVSSVTQSCPTLCDTMNCNTPDLPVHYQLPEFTQTHVHRVSDAIQPSHPLSSPSPPAPNPSQHQGLFQ